MNHPTEDLTWLAQRYVLGEMDLAEAAAFEESLADDEAAAAVVAAVRVVGAVKGAGHTSPVMPCGSAGESSRRWTTVAAAMAACGALVLVPFVAFRDAARPALDPAQLVGRWNGLTLASSIETGPYGDLEPLAEERLPRWLLAAVTIASEAAVKERN